MRLLITESTASAGSIVPFYFQPTLGGSNINGNPWLSSYSDYRFRAPNTLLLREAFEHSIWGPIGFAFSADQGKVALERNDVDFNHLAHSYSVGLTLRAGGLPALSLAFAWGASKAVDILDLEVAWHRLHRLQVAKNGLDVFKIRQLGTPRRFLAFPGAYARNDKAIFEVVAVDDRESFLNLLRLMFTHEYQSIFAVASEIVRKCQC